MDGIINVYKEKGWTSHDVVAKLRSLLHVKKIGHTGTLDPDAEGVLPVCVGKATKVCDVLTDQSKTYQAVLLLGVVTDTQDLTGTVLRESPVTCTEEALKSAVQSFAGEQQQIPPMYSARKVGGKKLYELARSGVEVEREPRTITVQEIRIERLDLPEAELLIRCSKGTYIRTLCYDIGEKLGCGGCMKSLVRTRVGPFLGRDARTLSELESLIRAGRTEEILLPTDFVFEGTDRAYLTPGAEKLVRNGNAVSDSLLFPGGETGPKKKEGKEILLYAGDGTFLALYSYREKEKTWRAEKMFLQTG